MERKQDRERHIEVTLDARPHRTSRLRAACWLAAAVTALSAVSCSAGAGRAAGPVAGWSTYTQPPGPMRLSFRYPRAWKASGATFIYTQGNVGRAQVVGATSATIAQFDRADCRESVRLLHDTGVLIEWWENIGSPIPIRLSQIQGRKVRVDGRPARLTETTSRVCGPERLINGVIQVGPRRLLGMHAEVAANARPATLAAVRHMFFSARS